MPNAGLRFRISGQPYQQVLRWQASIDHMILSHQLRTRGQALVTKSLNGGAAEARAADTVMKIRDLPQQGQYQPYYGSNGAYRFTFQPMVEGCRLEVFNQMAGFAFYLPERVDPLNLYLFQPVEELQREIDVFSDHPLPALEDTPMFVHDTRCEQMIFTLAGEPYNEFTNWAWSRRALHAYHFIFVPTASNSCEARVFARESGITLDLTAQEML